MHLAGWELFHQSCWERETDTFFPTISKNALKLFFVFFSQNFPLGVPVLYRRVRWKELQVGNGTEFQLEFSGQPVMVFQVFLQFPWLNHAHSGRSLFPCTSEMTKLTLTVKTDYVMSGTRDVDPHGRWNRSNDRKKWIKISSGHKEITLFLMTSNPPWSYLIYKWMQKLITLLKGKVRVSQSNK